MGCGKDDCGCDGGKGQATMEAGQDECMAAMAEMGKPAPEHANLKAFVGTWNAVVKMWMGPGGEPMVSGGVMVNTFEFGDKWLRHEYKGDEGFAGSGFMGFNKTTEKYEGFWIDTMSTFMQTETGDYDAGSKTFTMTSSMVCPMAKVPMDKRTVLRIENPDRYVMEMYFAGEGQPECKCMEITYSRKK